MFEEGTAKIIARADIAAENVVSSLENGLPFRCTRVGGALVTAEDCVNRALTAKDDPVSVSPCLECATVMAILRKIKPKKEIIEMARPRKTEPVETAAPVLEPVNPFEDWKQYVKQSRVFAPSVPFASLRKDGTLGISKAATKELGLLEYSTVDLYFSHDHSIGLVFHRDDAGTHAVTHDRKGQNVMISLRGMAKSMGAIYAFRHRYNYITHAPGIVEINLTKPME